MRGKAQGTAPSKELGLNEEKSPRGPMRKSQLIPVTPSIRYEIVKRSVEIGRTLILAEISICHCSLFFNYSSARPQTGEETIYGMTDPRNQILDTRSFLPDPDF